MKCYKHEDREAEGRCVRCGKILCEDCIVKVDNRVFCKECVSDMLSKRNNEEVYQEELVNDSFYGITGNEGLKEKSIGIKNINVILGVVSILFSVPNLFNNFFGLPYVVEDLMYTFKYHGAIKATLYLLILLINLAIPLAIIGMSIALITNFNKVKKSVRIILPIVFVLAMVIIKYILGVFIFSYFNYNIFREISVYIIPVILMVIGNVLGE